MDQYRKERVWKNDREREREREARKNGRKEYNVIFIATLHAKNVTIHSGSIPLIWCCNKKPLPIDLLRVDKLIYE